MLREIGFVDVETLKIRLPVGEWSRRDIDLGRYYRVGLSESLEPLSLAVFTRPGWNWSLRDVKRYLGEVNVVVNKASIHAYNDL